MRAGLLLGLLLLGCGSHSTRPDAGFDAGSSDGGDNGMLRAAGLTGIHLNTCDDPGCGNGMNPPLGGDHCPTTLSCVVFDTAQPRCNWIHNLEHGHAVLAYNCPTGCPDLVQQLTQVWTERQGDNQTRRILLTPDPKLPHRLAAIVWGFGWQGDVFDAVAINTVFSHQDEEAPERLLGCVQ